MSLLAKSSESTIKLLRELTEAHAISGHEDEVRAIFIEELGELGELSADRLGSVFCEMGSGPRVMVTAHMDEIGLMVQNITPQGFLQFVGIGGWWEHCLLSQRVEILTRKGDKILGVIASRPPHFLPAAQRTQLVPLDQMFIDVGADTRHEVEMEMGIRIGDPIAPVSSFSPMARPGHFMAKAFDNRVGVAAMIQCGQQLFDRPHPNRLILAGTVQEEIGLRGAKTAAQHARPDVALVLEGPPADDSPGFAPSESQGKLGAGVQIRLFDPTAISNPRLVDLAIRTARELHIPHQITVRRSGGTDAGALHLAHEGVPTLVLGVPARYIHSHNAIIDIDDYHSLLALTTALVSRLDAPQIERLVTFF